MADKHTTTDIVKSMGDSLLNGVIEVWFLITIGLLGLLGVVGKKMLNRFYEVSGTYVPSKVIDKRFADTRKNINDCQKELKSDISEVKDNVSEVHTRIDDIFHLLVEGNSHRSARRKGKDDG